MCKQNVWVGVDLAKASFQAALAWQGCDMAQWSKLPTHSFKNDLSGIEALCAWVHKHMPEGASLAGVCVEATGRLGWAFCEGVGGRLGAISVVNPAWPVQFARSIGLKDKTDRIDACVLALYGVSMRPAPRPQPTDLQRELRELARLYEDASRAHTACNNRIKAQPTSAFVRRHLEEKLAALLKEIGTIEAEMDRVLEQDPILAQDFKLLQSIPGVGPKTARMVLAQLGDLRQYKRNEVAALAGLYPKQHQSGSSVKKKARLAKGGGAPVRRVLYMAVLSARRFCPTLKSWADSLRTRHMGNMAIMGAVMRKLLLLMRAIVVSGKAYSPTHNDTAETPASLA